ncbi:prepilin-type N-terminal cleavage/methylation domain-containing protein, partial [Fretibacterium fastidiosum]
MTDSPLFGEVRRRGFTLIEIMIVLTIVGLMAAVLAPRISFYYEPPAALLQRSVEEAGDLALSGVSIRFVLRPEERSRRGRIDVEALVRRAPDSRDLGVFLGTARAREGVLAWSPVKLAYPPAGAGW